MYAPGPGILPESFTHLVDKVPVPSRCHGNAAREHGALSVVPDALRSVSHAYLRNPETFNRSDIKIFKSSDIIDFLFQCHLGHQFSSLVLGRLWNRKDFIRFRILCDSENAGRK